MKFLHDQNVVHRDVKSDNLILLNETDDNDQIQVKLADFGLAVMIKPGSGGVTGHAGTPEYMAPEVVL